MEHQVREEEPRDEAAVRLVHQSAFPTSAEADLVDALRPRARPLVSLVAEADGRVAGHILFSPVEIPGLSGLGLGLAPMAVEPQLQRRGLGSALVREGLEACRRLGARAVVVLGHRDYYPRFGFWPAAGFDLACEYDVSPEHFMALELVPGALGPCTGVVCYHEAFGEL